MWTVFVAVLGTTVIVGVIGADRAIIADLTIGDPAAIVIGDSVATITGIPLSDAIAYARAVAFINRTTATIIGNGASVTDTGTIQRILSAALFFVVLHLPVGTGVGRLALAWTIRINIGVTPVVDIHTFAVGSALNTASHTTAIVGLTLSLAGATGI